MKYIFKDYDWYNYENETFDTEITNTFGKDVYKNNDLDRKKLAQLVFNNPEALSKLNALVHPKVGVAYQSWLQKQSFFICFCRKLLF